MNGNQSAVVPGYKVRFIRWELYRKDRNTVFRFFAGTKAGSFAGKIR